MAHSPEQEIIEGIIRGIDDLSEERKALCVSLSEKIRQMIDQHGHAQVIFICTHNSRRSHMAQVWAAVAAAYYKKPVISYSGGTEETAVYPTVLDTFAALGLESHRLSSGENPVHSLSYGEGHYPLTLFSKTYDHPSNPHLHFGAVMTCGHAEENCPFIPEAEFRFPMTYVDPKHSDGSDEEEATYKETCLRIGTEMFYTLSLV